MKHYGRATDAIVETPIGFHTDIPVHGITQRRVDGLPYRIGTVYLHGQVFQVGQFAFLHPNFRSSITWTVLNLTWDQGLQAHHPRG